MGEAESSSSSVFQVVGEPAVCVNGLPEMSTDGSPPTPPSSMNHGEAPQEPYFGRWFEGREVYKLFGGRYYWGKVVDFDSEMKWYRVVYEDGDFEDLDQDELEEVLLPLDVFVPLEALFLNVWHRGKLGGESEELRKSKGVDRTVRQFQSTKVGLSPESQSLVAATGRRWTKKGGSNKKSQRNIAARALETAKDPID
ncbi:unnamed protein product [Spirodela intermedia]|uniref:PTM/DIR17-like Tudor domain-containing protein n=1 Tax=Spirodela intermedia TaxID=51605 RepID=A0A7I8L8C2_SPIIN|nr:unnamed protein product [Spirodela intermedia]